MQSWNGSGRGPEPGHSARSGGPAGGPSPGLRGARKALTPTKFGGRVIGCTGPGRVRLSPYSAFDEEDDEVAAIHEPPAEIEARYRIAPEFRPLPATDVPVLHLDAPGLRVSSLGFGLQSAVPREMFRREPPPLPEPRHRPGWTASPPAAHAVPTTGGETGPGFEPTEISDVAEPDTAAPRPTSATRR